MAKKELQKIITTLATKEEVEIAKKDSKLAPWWADNSKVQLLYDMVCKGNAKPTMEQFGVHCYLAKQRGLDPFSGQIHLVVYNSKSGPVATSIVGIGGYRSLASQSGRYGGNDGIQYEFEDIEVTDGEVTEVKKQLVSATCTVYRLVDIEKNGDNYKRERVAFTATVFFDEYYPADKKDYQRGQWDSKTKHMLGKVAESHALRMAFPEDLSGLYVKEEVVDLRGDVIDAEPVEESNVDDDLTNELNKANDGENQGKLV